MSNLLHDLRHGIRQLSRNPGFRSHGGAAGEGVQEQNYLTGGEGPERVHGCRVGGDGE